MQLQHAEVLMPLSSNAFRSLETSDGSERGQPVDLPSGDGRMLAVGREPAVETLPRQRRVPEKSTATMQYEKCVNNSIQK
jgi:hypothetical protein